MHVPHEMKASKTVLPNIEILPTQVNASLAQKFAEKVAFLFI